MAVSEEDQLNSYFCALLKRYLDTVRRCCCSGRPFEVDKEKQREPTEDIVLHENENNLTDTRPFLVRFMALLLYLEIIPHLPSYNYTSDSEEH